MVVPSASLSWHLLLVLLAPFLLQQIYFCENKHNIYIITTDIIIIIISATVTFIIITPRHNRKTCTLRSELYSYLQVSGWEFSYFWHVFINWDYTLSSRRNELKLCDKKSTSCRMCPGGTPLVTVSLRKKINSVLQENQTPDLLNGWHVH